MPSKKSKFISKEKKQSKARFSHKQKLVISSHSPFNQWIEDMEKTKIWNIDKKTLQISSPKGYKYNAKVRGEARYYPPTDEIQIGDKFFNLSQENKRWIIYHELGHRFETKYIEQDGKGNRNSKVFWDIVDSDVFGKQNKEKGYYEGIWGEHNLGEAIASSFAEYYLESELFKSRYPKAFKFMELMIKEGKTAEQALNMIS